MMQANNFYMHILNFVAVITALIVIILMVQHIAEKQKITTAKQTAESMISEVAEQSDYFAFKWLRGAGWAVAPFALPVGVAAMVAGNIALAAQKGINLRKARMPESWYDQVVIESSIEGKRFLGAKLKSQGYISVAQAARWLEIETKANDVSNAAKTHLIQVASEQPSTWSKIRLALQGK